MTAKALKTFFARRNRMSKVRVKDAARRIARYHKHRIESETATARTTTEIRWLVSCFWFVLI
jgi:hypothetical protein